MDGYKVTVEICIRTGCIAIRGVSGNDQDNARDDEREIDEAGAEHDV